MASHNAKTARNRRILEHDRAGKSLREIATLFGMTPARVGQILLRLRGHKWPAAARVADADPGAR